MGTSIKIEALRGEETTDAQWKMLKDYFDVELKSFEDNGDSLNCAVIYCSYSLAELDKQIDKDIREKLKGSDITVNMWYLETDPDQTIILWGELNEFWYMVWIEWVCT